jgi:hypothetical protein
LAFGHEIIPAKPRQQPALRKHVGRQEVQGNAQACLLAKTVSMPLPAVLYRAMISERQRLRDDRLKPRCFALLLR